MQVRIINAILRPEGGGAWLPGETVDVDGALYDRHRPLGNLISVAEADAIERGRVALEKAQADAAVSARAAETAAKVQAQQEIETARVAAAEARIAEATKPNRKHKDAPAA